MQFRKVLNVTKSHVTKSLFGVMWRKNEKSHVSSGGANEKGEPWFVGRNVARRLGVSKHSRLSEKTRR